MTVNKALLFFGAIFALSMTDFMNPHVTTFDCGSTCGYYRQCKLLQSACIAGQQQLKRPLLKWTKRGHTCLFVPCSSPLLDVTISMDISPNPGPQVKVLQQSPQHLSDNLNLRMSSSFTNKSVLHSQRQSLRRSYLRSELFALRPYRPLPEHIWIRIKEFGLAKRQRGHRGGFCKRSQPSPQIPFQSPIPGDGISDYGDEHGAFTSTKGMKIPVLISNGDQRTKLAIQSRVSHRFRNFTRIRTSSVTKDVALQQVKFCLWNAQSIRNKSACFADYICEQKIDIFALTETWLTNDDSAIKAECLPDGYKVFDHPRTDQWKGGGTALVCCSNFTVEKICPRDWSSFEISEWTLENERSSRLRLSIIYRPPYSAYHPVTVSVFLNEIAEYLESVILCSEPVMICGDFNIHADNPADHNTVALYDLFNSMGLKQHVDSPTQVHGHVLDLIVTRSSDNIILDTPVSDSFLSDHATVLCDLKMIKSKLIVKDVMFRKLKSINMDAFKHDLCTSDLLTDTPSHLDTMAHSYNRTLASLLDEHAPLCSRTIITRPGVPWFSDEIRQAKRLRRRAERKWRSSGLDDDLRAFKFVKNRTTYIMNRVRCEFYREFVGKNSSDQRKLFSAIKELLNRDSDTPFPPNSNKLALANDLGAYFVKKITDIRADLDSVASPVSTSSLLP